MSDRICLWAAAVTAVAMMTQLDPAFAQAPQASPELVAAAEARTFADGVGGTLPYRLLRPLEVTEGVEYPLLVFLHGMGERGDDNVRQLIWLEPLADEGLRARHPAFVVVPQCPLDTEPGPPRSMWTQRLDLNQPPQAAPEPAPAMKMVMGIMDAAIEELPIDARRIYVAGLSMGGYGTWDLAWRRHEQLAAIVPICGGGDVDKAKLIADLPTWVVHGGADPVVPAANSRRMVAALEQAGGRPIYTELEGVGHDSWSPAMKNRLLWDWLFAQRSK